MRTRLLVLLPLACALRVAGAQQSAGAPPADTMFVHAQRLVSEGQGGAGRAIVDSLLAAAPPGSARYAEALFWRAALAPDAVSAERDYRRLSVEFPLSPRSADALMRLAQMELARGDGALALRHLERLTLEYPNSPARARAGYWMARVYFDQGDAPHACEALRSARGSAAPGDVELQNQLDYSLARCTSIGPVIADSSPAPVAAPRPSSGTPPSVLPSKPPTGTPTPGAKPAVTAPLPTAKSTPAGRQPLAASRSFFAVQVAATASGNEARALVRKLAARKLDAWIDSSAGTTQRVRVGHYVTRADAEREAARLKKQGMKQAFVVAGVRTP